MTQKPKTGWKQNFRPVQLALWFGLMMLLLIPEHGYADGPLTGSEYRVKAAFLYHFARFIQWPKETFKDTDDPLGLCVASTRPETGILSGLQDKLVRTHRIVVRKYEGPECIDSCHILFITSDDPKVVLKWLNEAKDRRILTVSDAEDFVTAGGIIGFFMENQRLRFRVNLDAATRAGLKFSAQLLMSAEIVRE